MPSIFELLEWSTEDLQALARERDLAGRGSMSKAELQKTLADETPPSENGEPSEEDTHLFPRSEVSPGERVPREELESHFDSAEARLDAIREAAVTATQRAIEEKMSQVVVESFRKKDYNDPLSLQPSYTQRHPDTVVVFEATVPLSAYPILGAKKSSIRL